MDRCPGVVATEANSAQCGGRWRPREFEYWGIEPRLDISHNLFGVESDAVLGLRYHRETQDRNQFRGADPRFQSLSYAESFYGVNGGTGHREQVDIDVEAKSYYAQNTFYLGNWSLTPGIRVEDIRISTNVKRAEGQPQNNPESDLTNNQTKVLPGFGVAWSGIENTTVFAGVHRGFAPPRPDRDISAGGANTAVVAKTKPEESTNWELGIRSNYLKGISYETTLFHTQFDEIVISDGFGSFRNGGESQHSGIEVGGRIDFGTIYNTSHNFYISGAYTNLFTAKFKKTSLDDDIRSGDRLAYAPKHIASLSFGYEHPIGFNARIGVDYVSEQYEDVPFREGRSEYDPLSGQSGKIPSYTLVNASLSYRPIGSKATFFVSGHNLGDKEYLATRVDGMHAGRQRQVFGGVRYDF
ncbi:TonB-dependent receptor family protein [Methylobacillus flagellatus]|uniref:TonB-dependent receptor n=2 Tax=root TaxID=1 RepID=Q1H2P2_METFK|nr:TonB-dependent receptor [Methylobacillus flagellatus]ABE49101.1 TonB-dependent receptor [Methylobacillus flagellatus KT]ABE49245.1 TonB-dependent receptor [Methylobacillus flagellatus KT]